MAPALGSTATVEQSRWTALARRTAEGMTPTHRKQGAVGGEAQGRPRWGDGPGSHAQGASMAACAFTCAHTCAPGSTRSLWATVALGPSQGHGQETPAWKQRPHGASARICQTRPLCCPRRPRADSPALPSKAKPPAAETLTTRPAKCPRQTPLRNPHDHHGDCFKTCPLVFDRSHP